MKNGPKSAIFEIFAERPYGFWKPGAKRSQDDKPLYAEEPVRAASVDHGFRSHLSLRSRRGMKVSATWPPLTELSLALPITARPFGLGFRCDEAPSGNGAPSEKSTLAPDVSNQPARMSGRYHKSGARATSLMPLSNSTIRMEGVA